MMERRSRARFARRNGTRSFCTQPLEQRVLLAAIQSDDFNSYELNDHWTFTDPVGDVPPPEMDGTSVLLHIPSGTHKVSGSGVNGTARLTQAVSDPQDFSFRIKYDNVPSGRTAYQGMVVEQDGGGTVMFEIRSDAPAPKVCWPLPNFDFDGDQHVEALSDGILLTRYMAGFRGESLTRGLFNPTNAELAEATARLESKSHLFDIDGDGQASPLTDGILVLRFMAGFQNASLISDAIGQSAVRTTAVEVVSFLVAARETRDDLDTLTGGTGAAAAAAAATTLANPNALETNSEAAPGASNEIQPANSSEAWPYLSQSTVREETKKSVDEFFENEFPALEIGVE